MIYLIYKQEDTKMPRGRPKGSKNKTKIKYNGNTISENDNGTIIVKRGRGRPKGSKNKPAEVSTQPESINIKEIKRQIRELRKLKRDTQKKSDVRHDLNRQIRDLKNKLRSNTSIENIDPAKAEIIKEIIEYNRVNRPYINMVDHNYNQYSLEKLIYHLKNLKEKRLK
jgi:hypothetical protein